ncbi:hypothetical protein WR25_21488 [Diploscapter pachys]|uniref:Uncharacterized protein n=1 Tax=Diploscapter pachys TaxID=2018661 RepID=A0A2A2LXN7_9BILA|nr:hypothetical protein WR25_21488 [Diploscapter pachys]
MINLHQSYSDNAAVLLLQNYEGQGDSDSVKGGGGKRIDKIIRERQGTSKDYPIWMQQRGRMDDALFSQTEKECENADWLNDL